MCTAIWKLLHCSVSLCLIGNSADLREDKIGLLVPPPEKDMQLGEHVVPGIILPPASDVSPPTTPPHSTVEQVHQDVLEELTPPDAEGEPFPEQAPLPVEVLPPQQNAPGPPGEAEPSAPEEVGVGEEAMPAAAPAEPLEDAVTSPEEIPPSEPPQPLPEGEPESEELPATPSPPPAQPPVRRQ